MLLACVIALLVLLPTAGVAADGRVREAPGRARWVGTWSVAVTEPAASGTSAEGFTDTTLRQVAHVSIGGDQVRLRISNAYGEEPLLVSAVTVSPRADWGSGTPEIDVSQLAPVTFDGERSVTIPAHAEWISDPVDLEVPDDSDLVVSMHLPGPTGPATTHRAGYATSFTAPGDATEDAGDAFTALDTSRYYLEGVDVVSRARGAVVFFGDSITDGVVSTVDANLRYPDQVADRFLAHPSVVRQCGVLNAGISGNRVLLDRGTSGDSALARFDRDVLGQTGEISVVLMLGINDIGNSRGALEPEELIAVYRQFITRAHEEGLRVFGATLTPYEGAGYYSEAGEEDRQAVNEWIRTSGEFDGVVDFDAAVRDPDNPGRILPAYDVGDHLHPNDAGFTAMAAAVPLGEVCR